MSSHDHSQKMPADNRRLTFVLVGILLLLGVGLTALARQLLPNLQGNSVPVEATNVDRRMLLIADKLQCPVCEGQSVAFSGSQLAAEMRRMISNKLLAGESEAQIMAYFVERYGAKILREPPRGGLNAWLWITPVVAFVLAAGWLFLKLRRGSKNRPEEAAPVGDTSDLDAEVRELLAHYDEELFTP